MSNRFSGIRGRLLVGCLTAAVATVIGMTGAGVVQAASGVRGSLKAFPISGTYQIQQLFAAIDGQVWFMTPTGQLGQVSSNGVATLTATTLSAGTRIAGVGAEGEWLYSPSTSASGTCTVSLVAPGGTVTSTALPSPAGALTLCIAAAADASGNLWVAVDRELCTGCMVSSVARVTPAGVVTEYPPGRPGARPTALTLGSDGAIWVLQGYRQQTLVRYSSTGTSTSYAGFPNDSDVLLARPDGTFWVGVRKTCVAHGACQEFFIFDPATSTDQQVRLLPVEVDHSRTGDGVPYQFAVDAAGAVWAAGDEVGKLDRLFRMDTSGLLDRTEPLSFAASFTPMTADGTLAITPSGVIWASATSDTGMVYLMRYIPSA
jgi:streptogramin lyase